MLVARGLPDLDGTIRAAMPGDMAALFSSAMPGRSMASAEGEDCASSGCKLLDVRGLRMVIRE